MKKLKIVIIGNMMTRGSADVFLRKFLKILLPFAEKIYVFSDWIYVPNNERVEVVTPVHSITKLLYIEKPSIMIRVTRYILVQFDICVNLLKLAKHSYVVLVLDTLMGGPIFLAKLMRKKVVPFAAGRASQDIFLKKSVFRNLIRKIAELLKHIVFILSDIIIVESDSLVYWLNLSKYKSKIRIRSTFVDMEIFKPMIKVSKRDNIVGYIGGLTELKGVTQFVEAIPLILKNRPDIGFLICGDGPCYKEIEHIISKYDDLKKVKLNRWVQHSEVPKYLNQLKLLVLPSQTEGLPNIVLEAMACGTPVLTTRVGAIPDVIKDGETGFLLKSNDPKHIADKIIELLNKPELLEKVSINAYNYVRENFSYEKTLQAWRKILQEMEKQNKRRSTAF